MRKPSEVIINGKTLEEILENHLRWLKRDVNGWEEIDVNGWEEMRAKLDGADISNTDLRFVNLKYASLDGVNLYKSDLRWANFCNSSLQHTNLSYTDFREATLNDTNICDSNLIHADFCDASLVGAYLPHSNLTRADFQGTNLSLADLRGCVFYDTDLRDCNLWNANLVGAKDVSYIPLQCPSDGAFVGWKKVNNVLIKLEIPADAKRSSATTNKCRCDKAKVLGFYDTLGVNELDMTELVNDRYEKCKYVKGEMVYSDSFDEDRWNECSHGIHFFVNKQDAINYGC